MGRRVLPKACPRQGCNGDLARTGEAWRKKHPTAGEVIVVEYQCLQCNRSLRREEKLTGADFRSYRS